MSKRWRIFAISALFVLLSVAGTRLLSGIRFFEILNLKSLDAQFVLRGSRNVSGPPANIQLVVADQKALDTFPELRIFWHPYYAEALKAAGAAGARVVGLDVAFGVPVDKWEPDLDRQMSEAVASSPIPVVCGFVASLNDNQSTLPVPVNMVAATLGLSGYSNLTVDSDDFVRRQELKERADASGVQAHSFALLIAEKFQGHDIPLPATRSVLINYAGPSDTFPRVSLADVITAARAGRKDQLRQWLGGKIVLIGADAVDDRYATPFYTVFKGPHWLTSGVEIHANTVRTLLDHDYLAAVPEWARLLSMAIACAITIAIVHGAQPQMVAVWIGVETLALLAITQFLFRAGFILSIPEAIVAGSFSLLASIIFRFSTAERRGNLFRKAFSLFVGQQVAASLDDTQTIRLSGTRQNVTILFTDIRGFTAYTERMCEEQGPEVVVQVLNEYMAAMVAIIIRYHGHVNKFIGDGILAVFSDSDAGAVRGDHPSRAVQCAMEIVTAPSQFETGAGIHSGVAIVGNVGSADKMEFTVLGDTVNLASRLESLNKEHHTKLLMSEATERLLGNQVETQRLGSIAIRGKAAPINVYTVTALLPAVNVQ